MTWLRLADASMAWALEAARVCLLILGCTVSGWAVGFGMGYRRGVNDALTGDILNAHHRLNED